MIIIAIIFVLAGAACCVASGYTAGMRGEDQHDVSIWVPIFFGIAGFLMFFYSTTYILGELS